MVDVVGRIERRHAREEQLVIDLQRVDTHGLAEILELPAVDHVAAEPGDGRARRDRVEREHADTLRYRRTRTRARMKPRLPYR